MLASYAKLIIRIKSLFNLVVADYTKTYIVFCMGFT